MVVFQSVLNREMEETLEREIKEEMMPPADAAFTTDANAAAVPETNEPRDNVCRIVVDARAEREPEIRFRIVGSEINKSGLVPCCIFKGEVQYGKQGNTWEVRFGQKEIFRMHWALKFQCLWQRKHFHIHLPWCAWVEKTASRRQLDRNQLEQYIHQLMHDDTIRNMEPFLSFLEISPLRAHLCYGPSLKEGYAHVKMSGAEHYPFYRCNSLLCEKGYRHCYRFGMKIAYISCVFCVILPLFILAMVSATQLLHGEINDNDNDDNDIDDVDDENNTNAPTPSTSSAWIVLGVLAWSIFVIVFVSMFFRRRLGTQRRWIVLKSSYLALFQKRYDVEPTAVFLFDHEFQADKGGWAQGVTWMPNGLTIASASGMLELDAGVYYTRLTNLLSLVLAMYSIFYVAHLIWFDGQTVDVPERNPIVEGSFTVLYDAKVEAPRWCGVCFVAPVTMYVSTLEKDVKVLLMSMNPITGILSARSVVQAIDDFGSSSSLDFSFFPSLLGSIVTKGTIVGFLQRTDRATHQARSFNTSFLPDIGELFVRGMFSQQTSNPNEFRLVNEMCTVDFEVAKLSLERWAFIFLTFLAGGIVAVGVGIFINYAASYIGFWHAHIRRDHWLKALRSIEPTKTCLGGHRYDSFAPIREPNPVKKNVKQNVKQNKEDSTLHVNEIININVTGEVEHDNERTGNDPVNLAGNAVNDNERTGNEPVNLAGNAVNDHQNASNVADSPNPSLQWLVDGEATYDAICEALEEARFQILIAGWWLCPDLFLRRCTHPTKEKYRDTQLKDILFRKAEEGVKIYILLYKEVKVALSLGSAYAKSKLSGHQNVRVLRDPHFQFQDLGFWSHHEKIVCVDQERAFIGGLDLCFGRFDNAEHRLADLTNSNEQIWMGKDYSNPLVKDFVDVHQPYVDLVDRNVVPRMPWHDVHCSLMGAPVHDVAMHFIQRWNFVCAKKDKQLRTGWCICCRSRRFKHLPRAIMPLMICPSRTRTIQTNNRICSTSSKVNQTAPLVSSYASPFKEDHLECKCQIVRSVSQWSAGVSTEKSIQNAYIDLIESAQHYVFIENQFFISGLDGNRIVSNRILQALVNRIRRAIQQKQIFRVYVVMPLLPSFEANVDRPVLTNLHAVMHWQFATICRGKDSFVEQLRQLTPHPEAFVSFFGLRKFDIMPDGKLATEQIYVHSKVMIVDDRKVILGSANINDRSMNGNRDSEIAVVMEDTQLMEGKMNGQSFLCGRLAQKLRLQLFREHMKLVPESSNDRLLLDPCHESTWSLLRSTAKENTIIFENLFHCAPSNVLTSFASFTNIEIVQVYENQRLIPLKGAHAWSTANLKDTMDYAPWTDVNGVPLSTTSFDLADFVVDLEPDTGALSVDHDGWIYARNFSYFQQIRAYHLPKPRKRDRFHHFMTDRILAQVRRRRWIRRSLLGDASPVSPSSDHLVGKDVANLNDVDDKKALPSPTYHSMQTPSKSAAPVHDQETWIDLSEQQQNVDARARAARMRASDLDRHVDALELEDGHALEAASGRNSFSCLQAPVTQRAAPAEFELPSNEIPRRRPFASLMDVWSRPRSFSGGNDDDFHKSQRSFYHPTSSPFRWRRSQSGGNVFGGEDSQGKIRGSSISNSNSSLGPRNGDYKGMLTRAMKKPEASDCQLKHVCTLASKDKDTLRNQKDTENQLQKLRGHLVEFPLDFLRDELLKPSIMPSNIHI